MARRAPHPPRALQDSTERRMHQRPAGAGRPGGRSDPLTRVGSGRAQRPATPAAEMLARGAETPTQPQKTPVWPDDRRLWPGAHQESRGGRG